MKANEIPGSVEGSADYIMSMVQLKFSLQLYLSVQMIQSLVSYSFNKNGASNFDIHRSVSQKHFQATQSCLKT